MSQMTPTKIEIQGPIFPDDQDLDREQKLVVRSAMHSMSAALQNGRDRSKAWGYLRTPLSVEEVVEFFGRPKGTPAREGLSVGGQRMVAVWLGEEPEPTGEPEF